MKGRVGSICLVFAISLFVEPASGALITFGGLSGSNGDSFTSIVEAGFTVTATQGIWKEGHLSGNATPSIFSTSNTGQIEVDGKFFVFLSLETNDGLIASGTSSASYEFEGFLSNVSVLFGTGSVSPQYETNFSPNSSQVLDRLVITIDRGQTSSYNIDNISLDLSADPIIPEPTSLTLLGVGLLSMFGYRLSRKRSQPVV